MEHTINDICRDKKDQLHLTYTDIAEATKIPEATISKFFSPFPPKTPTFGTVAAICAYLGISLDEYCEIPVERDPRAEEMLEVKGREIAHLKDEIPQLKAEIVKRDDALADRDRQIARLQVLLDEKDIALHKGHLYTTIIVTVCVISVLFSLLLR